MAATLTYQRVYTLAANGDGSYTVVGRALVTVALGDSGGDGTLDTGESVTVNGSEASTRLYVGSTVDGDPVLTASAEPGAPLLLYTNASHSLGEQITPVAQPQFAFCFCAGTRILTVDGERAVETLRIGDMLLNTEGASVPVRWIGRQRRHPLFAALHQQLPIRIGAGALGGGLPFRDLYVSPDHAFLVDGCLVHAAALVNGRSIAAMMRWPADLMYFHIETERHELIVVEGAAAETFIDEVSRAGFDNHAEFVALYPDAPPMQALDLPRVGHARQLPGAIKRRLQAVADQLAGSVAA